MARLYATHGQLYVQPAGGETWQAIGATRGDVEITIEGLTSPEPCVPPRPVTSGTYTGTLALDWRSLMRALGLLWCKPQHYQRPARRPGRYVAPPRRKAIRARLYHWWAPWLKIGVGVVAREITSRKVRNA